MTHYMIGKVLQGRYQILQSLGAGVFGQTYIAVDIEQPQNPKCVVKQLKVTSSQPSYLETLRLRFLTETETLKHLGHHEQIPQLIACFEENERFFLVQEFIEGHALAAELPSHQSLGYVWKENEVIQFLQDVLQILEFIHSQGVIHCDVKPENLIRRAYDGKLVLIDFGSIQQIDFGIDVVLPISKIPVTSLGYIPPEQFISQPKPNSDIYALGMIAIHALTGLAPLQLKVDPQTNEFIWRSSETPVSDYLAAVLSQMIRHDSQERYKSAAEVLQVLKGIPSESEQPKTLEAEYTVALEPTVESQKIRSQYRSIVNSVSSVAVKPPSLLTGMKVGLVANSVVMGFCAYSLVNNSPAHSEKEALYKATEEYQAGDFDKAISLAQSVPENSDTYGDAQNAIKEWRQQWQTANQQFQATEKAFHEGRFSDVVRTAPQVPDVLYWQSKTDKLVKQAQDHIESQRKDLLAKAYEKAAAKDFPTALNYLREIPKETSAAPIVEQKLAEYTQKREIRANYLLQQAYKTAAAGDLNTAVNFLQQVPKETPVYVTAQLKLAEYGGKHNLETEAQKVARTTAATEAPNEKQTNNSSSDSTQLSKGGWLPGDASQVSSASARIADKLTSQGGWLPGQSSSASSSTTKTEKSSQDGWLPGDASQASSSPINITTSYIRSRHDRKKKNLEDFQPGNQMQEVNINGRH